MITKLMDRISPEPNTGCWLWCGGSSKDGYGLFYNSGKYLRAHRVSYAVFKGPIPDGNVVMHLCDTPACVNPDHLKCGTQWDNAHDAIDKGRSIRGSSTLTSKLKEEDIAEIRKSKLSQRRLAEMFSVSQKTIYNVINYKWWKL